MGTPMLLLDSQAVLWLMSDNPRLGAAARARIGQATAVHVSVATVWELTIKSMLGKLTVPEKFAHALSEAGLVTLAVSAEHAEGITVLPELVRHDPFDRLIVSQARCEGLTLLTADDVLLGLGLSFVIDARL